MRPERWLATVLFTDIVGSTEKAAELGDRRWRALLQRHYSLVRRELRRAGGREVNTAGDGFLATFDSPDDALRCAWAIRDAVRSLGLEVRSGMHMGQVEGLGGAVGGIAVHIGARVAAQASAGEVLVSNTVRDLAAGSLFRFEDRGVHVLKGVPGEWRLFAVSEMPAAEGAEAVERAGRPARFTRSRGFLTGVSAFALLFVLAGLYVGLRDRAHTDVGKERSTEVGSAATERPSNQTNAGPAATGIVPPSHKQLTFFGNAGTPALSPDGKSIAYLTGDRLMVQDVAGGRPLEILRNPSMFSLNWSPDGSELVFSAREPPDSPGTFIIPRLGGTPRRLPFVGLPHWSSDGKVIASILTAQKRIWFTEMVSGDTSSIALPAAFKFVYTLDWSANGWIAFATGEPNAIWTIRPAGGKAQKVLQDSLDVLSPRWSPRGDALYYLRGEEHIKELWKLPMSPATAKPVGPPVLVLTGLQAGGHFTISADGKRLLYTRELRFANLWLLTLDGSEREVDRKQLTSGTSMHVWPSVSPDGKRVALSAGRRPAAEIFTMPLEGGPLEQLTFFGAFSSDPVWSPDGKTLAFGSNQGGAFRVWTVDAAGGPPRPFLQSSLTRHFGASLVPMLAWAPGPEILYSRPGHQNFHRIDPASGRERPLIPNDSVGYAFAVQVSPDLSRVALMWNRVPAGAARDLASTEVEQGLWIISLRDSAQFLVRKDWLHPIGWSADSQWIYAVALEDNRIVKVAADGSRLETLVTLDKSIRGASLTPDGRRLIVALQETQADVWLMENFDGG